MNRLNAMRERGICADVIDEDAMTISFPNGVVLPIQCWLDRDRKTEIDDPIDGGWCEFGNEEIGFGYYPVKLISEEEWNAQQNRKAKAHHGGGCARSKVC